MIVVVPYTSLHPRVVPAIARTWPGRFTAWRIDSADAFGYHKVLLSVAAMLEAGTDVAIVEHDVEVRTGSLSGFEACPQPWCFCPYTFSVPFDEAGLGFAPLGHTRFRASLAYDFRLAIKQPSFRLPGYTDLDRVIGSGLAQLGHRPHRHPTSVVHHHDYSAMTHGS